MQDEKDEDSSQKIPQYILKSIETIADSILVIERVANLHVKLSDAATLVNTSFAVQLLFRITIAFINIVTALYMVGVNFSSPDAVEALKTNVNYVFTAWAGSSAIELLVVVWVTSATCEEVIFFSYQEAKFYYWDNIQGFPSVFYIIENPISRKL